MNENLKKIPDTRNLFLNNNRCLTKPEAEQICQICFADFLDSLFSFGDYL